MTSDGRDTVLSGRNNDEYMIQAVCLFESAYFEEEVRERTLDHILAERGLSGDHVPALVKAYLLGRDSVTCYEARSGISRCDTGDIHPDVILLDVRTRYQRVSILKVPSCVEMTEANHVRVYMWVGVLTKSRPSGYHDNTAPLTPYPETEQVLDSLASNYRLGLDIVQANCLGQIPPLLEEVE